MACMLSPVASTGFSPMLTPMPAYPMAAMPMSLPLDASPLLQAPAFPSQQLMTMELLFTLTELLAGLMGGANSANGASALGSPGLGGASPDLSGAGAGVGSSDSSAAGGASGTSGAGGTAAASGPLSNSTPVPSKNGFAQALLQKIGAPVTPENLKFLDAWQKAEGGSADNPFNTTQDAPGASRFNSVGVKRYPSVEEGLDATVKCLENGRYGNIIAALKQGNSASSCAQALAGSPWGTGSLVEKIVG